MANNVVVSIIIPCYNYAQFLPETLDCILHQTFSDWECIVVDDGSADNSAEVELRVGITFCECKVLI